MMITSEQQAPLLRQRRFLILTSLAVIVFYALGVEPRDEANFNGLGLKITRPDRLVAGLWIIWGWSLWRYSQRVYELLSELWSDVLEDVYAEDRRIAVTRAVKTGNKLSEAGQLSEDMPVTARIDGHVRIELPDSQTLQSFLGETIVHFRDYVKTSAGGRRYPTLRAAFAWNEGAQSGRADQQFEMTLTRRQASILRLRAWVHSIIRLPAFSEHFMPLLIALTAVVAWLLHLL